MGRSHRALSKGNLPAHGSSCLMCTCRSTQSHVDRGAAMVFQRDDALLGGFDATVLFQPSDTPVEDG